MISLVLLFSVAALALAFVQFCCRQCVTKKEKSKMGIFLRHVKCKNPATNELYHFKVRNL